MIKHSAHTGNDSFYTISNPKGSKNAFARKRRNLLQLRGSAMVRGGCTDLPWGTEMRCSDMPSEQKIHAAAAPGWWSRWCYWLARVPPGHETPRRSRVSRSWLILSCSCGRRSSIMTLGACPDTGRTFTLLVSCFEESYQPYILINTWYTYRFHRWPRRVGEIFK